MSGGRKLRQRMAHKFGFHAVVVVEPLFKGKDGQHPVDVALHAADAVFLPGPELRAHEVDDRNALAAEVPRQGEVHVGEVDQDGDGGLLLDD